MDLDENNDQSFELEKYFMTKRRKPVTVSDETGQLRTSVSKRVPWKASPPRLRNKYLKKRLRRERLRRAMDKEFQRIPNDIGDDEILLFKKELSELVTNIFFTGERMKASGESRFGFDHIVSTESQDVELLN